MAEKARRMVRFFSTRCQGLMRGASVASLLFLLAAGQGYGRAAEAQNRSASASVGTVMGRVVAAGRFQNPKPLPVFKNRSFCGPAVPNETLLVGKDGGLRNAVITLHALDRAVRAEPGRLTLDNRKCAFVPHVQVAVAGSELLLKNSDPILHTVHARLRHETLFNVGLPRWREVTKRLSRAGVVRVDCDVLHTWMSAAIVVTDTPYFAVTDANGRFSIERLPVGEYRAEIWHEKLGVKSMRLSVVLDDVIALEVVYGSN